MANKKRKSTLVQGLLLSAGLVVLMALVGGLSQSDCLELFKDTKFCAQGI